MKTSITKFRRATCAVFLGGALPLAASACGVEAYVGEVCTFSFDWCPNGFLPADGRTLAPQQYQVLFSLLGNRFGGNGTTTFNLPDLRGRSVVGTGQGQTQGVNFPNNVAFAQQVGQQQQTLTPAQAPVAPHTHTAGFAPVSGPVDVALPASTGNLGVTAALPVGAPASGATPTATPASGQNYLTTVSGQVGPSAVAMKGPYTTAKPSGATLPADVSVTGNAGTAATTVKVNMVTGGTVTVQNNAPVPATQAFSIQSPGLGMTVCIAYNGNYPQRP